MLPPNQTASILKYSHLQCGLLATVLMCSFYLREYLTIGGRSPFNEWLLGVRDLKARARIRARLDRVGFGNLGDYASVDNGVFELRLFFGPGYRVYYGLEGDTHVVLLSGGTKATQKRDIRIAKKYWKDYGRRISGN
jgi:putative addiction module killer protein